MACDSLTVAGEDLSGFVDIVDKTQYQTAAANTTTFAGNVTTSALTVNQISALNPTTTTGVAIPSIIEQSIGSTSSGISLYLVNPSLSATSGSWGMQIGTAKTTSNAAWQMLYINTNSSGSTSNRLDFKMLNQSTTLSLSSGLVGINKTSPTEALDVSGNLKVSGTIAGTLLATVNGAYTSTTDVGNTYRQYSITSGHSPYELWFDFYSLNCSGWLSPTTNYFTLTFNTTGTNASFDYGYTAGTNAAKTVVWSGNAMKLWNSPFPAVEASGINLAGTIRLSRVPTSTSDIVYAITGSCTRIDLLNGYVTIMNGVLRVPAGTTLSSLKVSADTTSTGITLSGSVGYTR